jgi:hypothetical protein
MPITASLGALSYTRLGAETTNNWYLQTDGNYPFISLVTDPSNNIYLGGANFLMQFTDIGIVPIKNWSINLSAGGGETFVDYKYSSYYDDVGAIFTQTYQSTQFPNPTQYRMMWKMLDASGVIPPFSSTGGNQGGQYNSGNYGLQAATFAVNESNGYYYNIGYQFEFGQPGLSIQCNQFSDATSSGTLLAVGGALATGGSSVASGTGGQVTTDGYLTYAGYTRPSTLASTFIILSKSDNVVTTVANTLLPIWQRRLSIANGLTSSKLLLDSSNNSYFLANEVTSTNGYLLKYNSSGALQWQRRLAGTRLTSIDIDSSNNIYIAGNNSSNNLFIAKYNSSGVIQWQTKLAGATFTGLGIKYYDSNVYVAGATGSKGYMIKLPSDGSIPGDGSYYVGGTLTLTYSVATQGEAAGSITDVSGSNFPYTSATTASSTSISESTLTQSNTIINLT